MSTPSQAPVIGNASAEKAPVKLPEFRIDTGDSSAGTAGSVAYVRAPNAEKALEILREKVDQTGYQVEDDEGFAVHVYLNPDNVKLTEVEELDEDEETDQEGEVG